MKTNIIALTGKAGAGKDTVAEILADAGFICLSLAAPIKSMLCELYGHAGLSAQEWAEHPNKETPCPVLGMSYRQMAQTLGTEWAQYTLGNQHFWTTIATKKINQLALLGYQDFCITDLRFEHEERWLKAMGGEIWHIDRPNVAPAHPHISEQHAATPDWVCRNDGTLSDLTSLVRSQLDSKMKGVVKGVAL
jgi:hypothetical protein